jgi:hypothetical protein
MDKLIYLYASAIIISALATHYLLISLLIKIFY